MHGSRGMHGYRKPWPEALKGPGRRRATVSSFLHRSREPKSPQPMLHIAFVVAPSYIHLWLHVTPVRRWNTTSLLNDAERNMAVTDPRDRLGFDRRLEWLGAWSGIAWVVICGGGFGGSGLLPVWAASTKPEVLAAHLADIKYQILIGMLLVLIGG